MRTSTSLRWLVVAVSAAMLLAVAGACGGETVEVPGETVVVEKEVIKEVQIPGETVVVEKEVVKTVEVPGETITKEVVKTVEVPGETVVVKEEVIKTVEVPGETVVVTKEVAGPERVVVKEVPSGERYVRNVWGQLVERPQYGGTVTWAASRGSFEQQHDPYFGGYVGMRFVFEGMSNTDWTLPRDEYPYLTSRYQDFAMSRPHLAESWEISPDRKTYTFHIRPGVQWQNKAPVNGRELTAKDVEYTFHRNLGLGSGYTEPNQEMWQWTSEATRLESVTATDKYTVVMKPVNPGGIDLIRYMTGFRQFNGGVIIPPEVIEQHGDMKDWENAIGTGPYAVTDFVADSSRTFTRNPNYWMIDPIHPDLGNRLPYVEQVRTLSMPEMSTRVAALRTGKITFAGGKNLEWDQTADLRKTNPELVAIKVRGDQTTNPGFRMNKPPFDDIRVRIAMQKAINRHEINYAYYGSEADPTPFGYISGFAKGMFVPFAELPDEVKLEYEYDPEEAERLLDEAGYPRGPDGIRFSVTQGLFQLWPEDIDLATLVTAYWDKIGVDVTIVDIAQGSEHWASMVAGDYDIVSGWPRHFNTPPMPEMAWPFSGGPASPQGEGQPAIVTQIADPVWNEIIGRLEATVDQKEYNSIMRELDLHYHKQHWTIALNIVDLYMMHQPYLKGYRGEMGGGHGEAVIEFLPYAWIDQELKQRTGH